MFLFQMDHMNIRFNPVHSFLSFPPEETSIGGWVSYDVALSVFLTHPAHRPPLPPPPGGVPLLAIPCECSPGVDLRKAMPWIYIRDAAIIHAPCTLRGGSPLKVNYAAWLLCPSLLLTRWLATFACLMFLSMMSSSAPPTPPHFPQTPDMLMCFIRDARDDKLHVCLSSRNLVLTAG